MKQKFKYLDIMSESDIEKIHKATLKVLNDTGILIKDEGMLNFLNARGCNVDFSSERVRFPEKIVMDSISNCPSSFEGKARDINNNCTFASGKNSYFMSSPGMKTFDLDTYEPHEPTRKEFYDYIRILDALPNLDIQVSFPFYGFRDVPDCLKLLESNAAKIRVSSKVQLEGSILDNYKWNIEMAKAVDQDLFLLLNPMPPLTFYQETIKQLNYFVKSGMPFHICPGPTMGATSPATISGTLISNNALTIAGMVMAQLIRPGTRVWAGSMMMSLDMNNGLPAFGNISNSLLEASFNQMWRFYKIPCWTSASAWSSSKVIDYQAGYEMSMAALIAALSGSTAILFYGGLNAQLSAHAVKAIMDDDVAGMIKRFVQGIEVNEETLAVDLINEVGPTPGHFLDKDHTLNFWKSEVYVPIVADRKSLNSWLSTGKSSNVIKNAREKIDEILDKHKILELTPSQERALEDILQTARKYYRKKGLISDHDWNIYQKGLASANYPFA
ncbi:MAG: trimethylamine methyltransferase family protein [Candidatus Humimicrobiaceae bacterium]